MIVVLPIPARRSGIHSTAFIEEAARSRAKIAVSSISLVEVISRSQIPDMPDRMIAATAVHFDVPVISRDRRILSANLKTVW